MAMKNENGDNLNIVVVIPSKLLMFGVDKRMKKKALLPDIDKLFLGLLLSVISLDCW